MEYAESIIKKEGSKWVLYSHKGKKLGTFNSEDQAKKRERQINFFKSTGEDFLTSIDYKIILEKYFGR